MPAGAPKAGGRRKGRPTARAARRLDLRTAQFGNAWHGGALAPSASFARFVARPVRGKCRRWRYRRRWAAVMTIGRLAPMYRGRLLLPVLGKVTSTGYTDRLAVRLVSGQSAADFAALIYLHGSDARQRLIADNLNKVASRELQRSAKAHPKQPRAGRSGTRRARRSNSGSWD